MFLLFRFASDGYKINSPITLKIGNSINGSGNYSRINVTKVNHIVLRQF